MARRPRLLTWARAEQLRKQTHPASPRIACYFPACRLRRLPPQHYHKSLRSERRAADKNQRAARSSRVMRQRARAAACRCAPKRAVVRTSLSHPCQKPPSPFRAYRRRRYSRIAFIVFRGQGSAMRGGSLSRAAALRYLALEAAAEVREGYMVWWKKPEAWLKLIARRDQRPADTERADDTTDGDDFGLDDLYVATASESAARSETAFPGTSSVPRLLTLLPPPIDPELRLPADGDAPRDYGPDSIAEYALVIPARAVFPLAQLRSAITPELQRYFALPTLYVRTPEGQVTYLVSPEAPKQATEIIGGWRLETEDKDLVQNIGVGAQGLARWLATRPEGFAAVEPDMAEIAARHQAARRIIEIEPNDVAI